MRKELDIYASIAMIKNFEGKFPVRHTGVDIALIRENTEGFYTGLEHSPIPGVVETLKVVTKKNTERIAQFAFDFAVKNKRKKVTAIHKANIMKLADGLFLNVCRDVAKSYESSGITFNDMIVDNAAMQVNSLWVVLINVLSLLQSLNSLTLLYVGTCMETSLQILALH
jgi:isocitrate dehydrogenase (NAD+)